MRAALARLGPVRQLLVREQRTRALASATAAVDLRPPRRRCGSIMGGSVSQERLNNVQDEVLARIAGHTRDVDGVPVAFERVRTVVGEDEGGAEVVHSIECHRVDSKATSNAMTATTNNKPIVMLHGYGAGSLLFANNMARIAQRTGRPVIAVDWLGCAGSGRPPWIAKNENEAIDWFIEPLERWREQRGIEKFDVVGHSLGAYLAAHYALRGGKNHIDKLVLASPFGLPARPEDINAQPRSFFFRTILWLWEQGANPHHLIRGSGFYGRRLVEGFFQNRFGSRTLGFKGLDENDEATNGLLVDYMYQISAAPASGEHALSTIMHPMAYAKRPLVDDLPKITGMDVMVVFGSRDWMARDLGSAEHALSQMNSPRNALRVIPGTHHVYLNEVFDDDVTAFFDGAKR
ncbi:1-acylglycerol-3-phosphate O-acyltransferase [Hondaea fermentalgiana]|uniref:1-acylglycerol-3-phosphate O-acyltransferase n=1 Tax=Hondaea fermentalgiana TaxID=2315210 RepID=A0A2R5GBK0_9STRA|nr:1-acylglycerol-3-phosphate O-acyltransferase [Hondaea fermentalgiana]|eukprot:GBG25501.1 1-acylglycerol-3-phosphate O-acyltransferase [Hondaea fermentalgiana]